MENFKIKEKVGSLEALLGEFLVSTGRSINTLVREMSDFKDEMSDFKDEMSDFKDEMKDFKEEMKDFHYNTKIENERRFARWDEERKKADEKQDKYFAKWDADRKKADEKQDEYWKKSDEKQDKYWKKSNEKQDEYWKKSDEKQANFFTESKERQAEADERQAKSVTEANKRQAIYFAKLDKEREEYKLELKNDRKKYNKQWGDIANSLGRIVEDIIAPSTRVVIEKTFKDEIIELGTKRNKKLKKQNLHAEYDIVAISENTVYLIEVKTSPQTYQLDTFLKNADKFKILFPEYNDKKLVSIFAGLNFEQSFIDKATDRKIYIMAYKEWEYMDILNFAQIKIVK